VKWARGGKIREHEVLLVANGVGWSRAAAGVDTACPEFRPDAVISTGFCGACDPKLDIGDVVVATEVQCCGPDATPLSSPFPAVSPAQSHPYSGPIASIDHVAQTAKEKAALHAGGAIAVEMEASAVAKACETRGLPFYCVRSVTDLAGEDMENDFNRALRSDGQLDTMLIFSHALHHPVTRMPELIRLRQNSIRAARTLGDFFADCRF
jgi:nucleoside phosphorylase